MMEAAGLALSAWQVRFSGSPALRLITGPPLMMGSSGGTVERERDQIKLNLFYGAVLFPENGHKDALHSDRGRTEQKTRPETPKKQAVR